MITDDQLNDYRLSGEMVRVIRDNLEENDVKGIVVAWNEEQVMIRRRNRKVVKLDRKYIYQPLDEPRMNPEG